MRRVARKWYASNIVDIVLRVMRTVTMVTALMMVVGSVINYGYPLSAEQAAGMKMFFSYVWVVFILDRLLLIIFRPHEVKDIFSGIKLAMNILLILTILPAIVPWLGFLNNSFFRNVLLLVLSILELSYFLTHILGKKTNPSAVMAISFLVIILIVIFKSVCNKQGMEWRQIQPFP